MLKFTPTQESLHKVPHQLHLSSGNNGEMGFKWCLHEILALHTGMKFISNDCRGRVKLVVYTVRSPCGKYMHQYNCFSSAGAWVLHVTGTSQTQCPSCRGSFNIHPLQPSTQTKNSWLNCLGFRGVVAKSSFHFTNLIKLISMDRLTNYLLP